MAVLPDAVLPPLPPLVLSIKPPVLGVVAELVAVPVLWLVDDDVDGVPPTELMSSSLSG
jgi:hypothetical protein